MSAGLERLLRLRAMQEELGRMEFETEAAQLRAVERSAEQAGEEARASRERWFALVQAGSKVEESCEVSEDARLSGNAEQGKGARRLEEEVGRRTAERGILVETERQRQEARVEGAQGAYRALRRDRMQVATLHDAEVVAERTERDRSEQRSVDDWFGSRLRPRGRYRRGREWAEPGTGVSESDDL